MFKCSTDSDIIFTYYNSLMKKFKIFIAKNFSGFAYFYSYLKHRVFIAVLLSISVGVLDGFGLSMFLPLLQMVEDASTDGESLGSLSFIIEGFQRFGIPLSLLSILLVMVIFFCLKGLAQFISKAYRVILQQHFIRDMRMGMLNSLNRLKFKDFIGFDVGRIQNTMTGEIERVSAAYSFYFAAFEQLVLVIVYMVFAFLIDFQFAILVTIGGGLTNLIFTQIYKKTKKASRQLTGNTNIYQGQVIQHVSNFKYLQATGLTDFFAQKLKANIREIEVNRKRIGFYGATMDSAREPILIIVVASVIVIQVNVLEGSLGPILISLLFFYRALNALVNMQNSWNRYLERAGSMENVMSFQKEIEKKPFKDGEHNLDRFTERITLCDLDFCYGDAKILHGINLNIQKNESVAFVGESGSGKTTLVNIIAGLLPADKGIIKIDGIPYKDLKLTSLQKRIGYITQEPVIFNDTIFNNVSFWDEKTPENFERFLAALKKASLENFYKEFKDPENIQLGNNGINLSGGQKQRISIARELYKNVDILIMDEATSALDSETEKIIQENIDALKGSYTLLIIAHRLSTIKNVDRVVLMNNGEIQEIGTFKNLVHKVPRFQRMVELQEI